MLIIFEGVDGSGKTTLLREFNRKTNFKYICADRLFLSNYVYDSIRKDALANINLIYLRHIGKVIPVNIIYCYAKKSIIKNRIIARKENYDDVFIKKSLKYYKNGLKILNEYSKKSYIRIIKIDTSKRMKKCIDNIFKKL